MSHNTYNTNSWIQRGIRSLVVLGLVIMGIVIALSVLSFLNEQQENMDIQQQVKETEEWLTDYHGSEARDVVANYEKNRHSLLMYTNESFRSEVHTGPFLEFINRVFSTIESETYWTVTTDLEITGIRVIDYSSQRMRVIACVDSKNVQIDHDGKILQQLPKREFQGAYIFIYENQKWKLANFIDVTDPKQALQDWDYMSQELRNITGNINDLIYKSCKITDQ